jgi:hypothetical protein
MRLADARVLVVDWLLGLVGARELKASVGSSRSTEGTNKTRAESQLYVESVGIERETGEEM